MIFGSFRNNASLYSLYDVFIESRCALKSSLLFTARFWPLDFLKNFIYWKIFVKSLKNWNVLIYHNFNFLEQIKILLRKFSTVNSLIYKHDLNINKYNLRFLEFFLTPDNFMLKLFLIIYQRKFTIKSRLIITG